MTKRPLVSTDWLERHCQDDNVRVVDASWHLPASGRNAQTEFEAGHIPGSVFFDLDKHSSPSHLPHMMPTAEVFSSAVGQLGLSDQHKIIVYDTVGLFSAARLWWMFRFFGAADVSVLDGGMPAWLRSGHTVESGPADSVAASFQAGDSSFAIASADEVLKASQTGSTVILDARSQARFLGVEKEVRGGLRSGHIPGSKSMPFTELTDNGFLKPDVLLRALLQKRGAIESSSVITTCGSGVTAAVISLALECIGVSDVVLYDGSWTEWGSLPEMPVATA